MQSIYPSGEKLYPSLFKELSQLPTHDMRSYSRARINSQFSSYKISLLHLAVFKSDYQEAYFLLRIGANPNLEDHCNYTPLHHAALKGDLIMLEFLKFFGGNPNKKTSYNGTVDDILVLNRTYPDYPFKIYEKRKGKIREMTSQRFSKITDGAIPAKSMFASPAVLASFWEKIPEKVGFYDASLANAEEAFHFKHKLFLKEIDVKGRKTHGVFCDSAIKQNQRVLIYIGEQLKDKNTSDLEYTMDTVSSKKFRGLMAMINDGPPNLAGIPVYNFRGLPKLIVFYASRDIQKGEQLLINYANNHPVKFGSHVELNLPYVVQFLKERPLDKCIQFSANQQSANSPIFFKWFHSFDMLGYLLNTPTTMMEVITQGLVKHEHLLELLKHPQLLEMLDSYLSFLSFLHMAKITKLKSRFDCNPSIFPRIIAPLTKAYRHFALSVEKIKVLTYFLNAWDWIDKFNAPAISDSDFDNHDSLFKQRSRLELSRLGDHVLKDLSLYNNEKLSELAKRHIINRLSLQPTLMDNSQMGDFIEQILGNITPTQRAQLEQMGIFHQQK